MILVILTKEGAFSLGEFNLTRVSAITCSMLLGVLISVLICIFLWPESAHEKLRYVKWNSGFEIEGMVFHLPMSANRALFAFVPISFRQDMAKSLGSFRVLLKLLTKTFLLEDDMTPFGSESVQRLIESQVKSFSALANSLEEAQLEYPAIDIKKYEQCVRSLSTLAQYLNGLRSSCGLQYDMLKKDEQRNSQAPDSQSSTLSGARGHGIGMRMSSFSLIGSLRSDRDQSASADLIEFLDHVGKPMKSLALTCKLTIEHLQEIFSNSDSERGELPRRKISRNRRSQQPLRQSGYESGEMFSDATAEASATGTHLGRSGSDSRKHPSLALMQLNLAKALDIFEAANSKALKRFYSHQSKRRSGYFTRPLGAKKHMSAPSLQDLSARDGMDPEPGLADSQDALTEKAPVGEQIFLIYFFVFNLMEFSKELAHLVSCVEILVGGDEDLALWIARNQQTWWRRIWFLITGFPRRLRKVTPAQDVFDSFGMSERAYRIVEKVCGIVSVIFSFADYDLFIAFTRH